MAPVSNARHTGPTAAARWLAAASLLAAAGAWAQPTFTNRHLDRESGLTHDRYVMFYAGDSLGYTWIGTSDGVYRYSGQDLDRYELPEAYTGSRMVHGEFFEDIRGDVWHSTREVLVRHDREADTLAVVEVAPIAQAEEDDLYLFAYDQTADAFLASTADQVWSIPALAPGEAVHLGPTGSVRYTLVSESSRMGGQAWLGMPWLYGPGIERFETSSANDTIVRRSSTDAIVTESTVSAGTVDDHGGVWLASDRGLIAYDFEKDSTLGVFPVPGSERPVAWCVTTLDTLLAVASHDDGVWLFDPENRRYVGRAEVTNGAGSAVCSRTRWLGSAHSDILIASCAAGGVDILRPAPVASFSVVLPEGTEVAQILPAPRGGLYVRTHSGGLVHADTESGRVAVLVDPAGYGGVSGRQGSSMALGAVGAESDQRIDNAAPSRLYFCSGAAVYSLEDGAPILLHTFDEPIIGLYEFEDSQPLAMTATGLFGVDGTLIGAWAAPTNNALFAFSLADGSLAAFTSDGWLRRFTRPSGRYLTCDSLRVPGTVLSCEVAEDLIVVGSPDGLFAYEREGWGGATDRGIDLELDSVTAGGVLYAIGVDTSHADLVGHLTVLTSGGVAVRGPDGWRAARAEHGLPPANKIGLGRALHTDDNGIVWYPGGAGLIGTRPGTIARLGARGDLTIETASVDGSRLRAPRPVLAKGLKASEPGEHIDVTFATRGNYDLTAPLIEYRLIGGDEQWRATADGEVSIAGLTPGDYSLAVRARLSNLAYLPAISIPIAVPEPYYKRTGFLALLVIAVATVIGVVSYLVYRWRLRRQRAIHATELLLRDERDRIGRELHDELGSGLSTILFLSEEAGEAISEEDRGRIAELSRKSLDDMREIVWMLDERGGALQEFGRRIYETASAMCADRGAECHAAGLETLASRGARLPLSTRRNLYLIAKEATHNALRHGRASRVDLSFAFDPAGVHTMSIADDGIGFDHTSHSAGNGLANIRHRVRQMNGRFHIESSPEDGTYVRIDFLVTELATN